MNDTQKDRMIAWLNDAHAMELSLVKNLEETLKDAENLGKGDVEARIREHIDETKIHAIKIESCIVRLGGSSSSLKDMVGRVKGYMQGAMKSMFSDTMVKNAIEGYTAEHMEIAVYISLISAAQQMEDEETASVCAQILEDEVRMAHWFHEQIPVVTAEYLEEEE